MRNSFPLPKIMFAIGLTLQQAASILICHFLAGLCSSTFLQQLLRLGLFGKKRFLSFPQLKLSRLELRSSLVLKEERGEQFFRKINAEIRIRFKVKEKEKNQRRINIYWSPFLKGVVLLLSMKKYINIIFLIMLKAWPLLIYLKPRSI